ncbi:MAG: TetR/AcrR family transcriptional regulator [Bacteroidota bacterium]
MRETKKKILETARVLFNEKGVANVSIRMISRELGLSHSNLIYHFKDKNAVIELLHQQILEAAIALNASIKEDNNTIKMLFESVDQGFRIIYDYRFFMIDLNLIMRENPGLHSKFLEIEQLRYSMYKSKIESLIAAGIMKAESSYRNYDYLIKQIRIISDYWLSSAQIYESGEKVDFIVSSYGNLLKHLFYPYLTQKGESIVDELRM